jgi:tocopherol cyclase
MFYGIRKLYRPEFYQGPVTTSRYFEGWYFKLVGDTRAFALIPGVSRAADDPHAFLQFIDGTAGVSRYNRFPLESFAFGRDEFRVSVAESRFSLQHASVSVEGLDADLSFRDAVPWRGTLLQPGTMGWYSFVPFMECKHGVIVMDAVAEGTVDGEPWTGRLYVEKDYGRSFPNAWVWLQSNSFDAPGVSVTCSIANVPFIGGAFVGFLAGITVGGELHKFTTYTGCRIESISVGDAAVEIVIVGPKRRVLTIHAQRERGSELRSPRDGEMRGRVVETLSSRIDVEFRRGADVVFAGRGVSGGLEVVNPDLLLHPHRR